jgi:hypothetical protein
MEPRTGRAEVLSGWWALESDSSADARASCVDDHEACAHLVGFRVCRAEVWVVARRKGKGMIPGKLNWIFHDLHEMGRVVRDLVVGIMSMGDLRRFIVAEGKRMRVS